MHVSVSTGCQLTILLGTIWTAFLLWLPSISIAQETCEATASNRQLFVWACTKKIGSLLIDEANNPTNQGRTIADPLEYSSDGHDDDRKWHAAKASDLKRWLDSYQR
jgi:hypothetical protein